MQPQKGIFIEGNAQHWFLEFSIEFSAPVNGACLFAPSAEAVAGLAASEGDQE